MCASQEEEPEAFCCAVPQAGRLRRAICVCVGGGDPLGHAPVSGHRQRKTKLTPLTSLPTMASSCKRGKAHHGKQSGCQGVASRRVRACARVLASATAAAVCSPCTWGHDQTGPLQIIVLQAPAFSIASRDACAPCTTHLPHEGGEAVGPRPHAHAHARAAKVYGQDRDGLRQVPRREHGLPVWQLVLAEAAPALLAAYTRDVRQYTWGTRGVGGSRGWGHIHRHNARTRTRTRAGARAIAGRPASSDMAAAIAVPAPGTRNGSPAVRCKWRRGAGESRQWQLALTHKAGAPPLPLALGSPANPSRHRLASSTGHAPLSAPPGPALTLCLRCRAATAPGSGSARALGRHMASTGRRPACWPRSRCNRDPTAPHRRR